MNARERFLECLRFGHPDRVPFEPGFPRESTLRAWKSQGLPEGVDWFAHLLQVLEIDDYPEISSQDMDIDFRIIPQFEEKVLERRDGHLIVQDWMGAITEISDEYDVTYLRIAKDFVTRKWHHFPVASRKDWEEKIKWRYDPASPQRFLDKSISAPESLHTRTYPLKLSFTGPFWQLREWCGFEGLCTFMAEDKLFVEEMVSFWQKFVSTMLKRLLAQTVPDFVMINEDMAYKLHSMISPGMARHFLLPAWIEWVDLLHSAGVPLVWIDSDGYIGELLPLWIEAGFNGCYPVEVAAGNDIVQYRQQYGRKMAFIGGIDKRKIAEGGPGMYHEVFRVVPPLFKEGGYIPGCDHGVPPDISWHDFVDYARLLARLTGWIQ